MSNMNKLNFIPSVWGGAAWKFLHTVALSYPSKPTQQDKNDYKSFFTSLGSILPCETCAKHFEDNKKKHNIDKYLSGPHELFSWTVKIRNEVQKILGRPLWNEVSLRESLYNENVRAGGIFDIPTKYKIIILFLISIGMFYTISRFFRIKVTPLK